MWPDNETRRDFLNFTCVAETAAELIIQAKGEPLSVGVSGNWGVGKSSMLRLIEHAVLSVEEGNDQRYLFVRFNAWLFQRYDDARAALMWKRSRGSAAFRSRAARSLGCQNGRRRSERAHEA